MTEEERGAYVGEHMALYRAMARRRTRGTREHDIDDLVQEMALAVYLQLESMPEAEDRYLTTVAKHAMDKKLSGRRWTGSEARGLDNGAMQDADSIRLDGFPKGYMETIAPDPHDQYSKCDWEMLRPTITEGLGAITSLERRVLSLRFDEDRSFGEIAQLLGGSEGGARKAWARARRKLRAQFSHLREEIAA